MAYDLFSLAGQVALVTGSSRGLGRAIAGALARAGAHVVLNGRDAESLRATAEAMAGEGLALSARPFDVGDEAAAVAAVAAIADEFGRLDILVNNAGFAVRHDFADYPTADWRRVMDIDLTACFYLAREAVKIMRAQGHGRIINMASIMSFIARDQIAPYVAAKHALAGLTKTLAVECGPYGITCNAIAPGYFATDMTVGLQSDPDFDALIRGRTPLARWGRPEDLEGIAVFLAAPASAFINGQVIVVDGGMTIAL